MKQIGEGNVTLPCELSDKEIVEYILDLAKYITERGGGKIKFVREDGRD